MKNYEKISITVFMLMFNVLAFAQPGDTDGTPGGLDGDEPAAPISNKLIFLALLGIAYMFYKIKSSKKQLN
ncbi:hypothetical protein [uncultured Flavobacterium sp.]|uniref:hypothetical protein n=1 Tax=uncultured Flavobacterium sp. TaxID=165435 RepID=UPI0030ED15C2|tara:strand:- start:16058 stop:16270 length:213 start_codon:yes stop_codon:yes gene_type:complete